MVVALLGLGTVGRALYDILEDAGGELFSRHSITIKYILVRTIEGKQIKNKDILITDYSLILNDPEVDTVIECMGASCSYSYIKDALLNQKNVITANKEVISSHYIELERLAMENGVELLFEASCGGSIPIVNTLLKTAPYSHITRIDGILNGTTNYILSLMQDEKIDFNEALGRAMINGFAEADPTSDLEGLDMVRKIQILSSIAYGAIIDINDIYHSGIASVNKELIDFISLLGYRLKLIASSELIEDELSILVEPCLVEDSSIFSAVGYENNIVRFYSEETGMQMLIGKGAGNTTASSIMYDLNVLLSGGRQQFMPFRHIRVCGNDKIRAKYLLRAIGQIPANLIEKRIGNMIITTEITGTELKKLGNDIDFSARFLY